MRVFLFLLLVLGTLGATAAPDPGRLTWMSEEYPPYNFTADGEPRGIAVDVLSALWQRLQLSPSPQIRFLPWARAYTRLQHQPDTALFAMTYTPARQQQFRFVGPLIPIQVVLLTRKGDGHRILRDADLGSLQIGVVREDIGEQLLLERGVDPTNMTFSNLAANLVQLLHRGRVDAIAYSYDVAAWNMVRNGLNPGDFEVVYTLLEGELGYAFHRDTDPALLQRLQQTLDQLKQSGEVEAIRQRYLQNDDPSLAPIQSAAHYSAAQQPAKLPPPSLHSTHKLPKINLFTILAH